MKYFALAILLFFLLPITGHAQEDQNAIKLANYYLLSGLALTDDVTEQLSRYDLLVLPVEAQTWNPSFSKDIRALNPDIILLAYVPSVSWNSIWSDSVHKSLYKGIKSDFWLRDNSGSIVSIWPGTSALDLTSGWNDYLANFVADEVLHTDYWDGVFYDEVSDQISWVGNVQLANTQSSVDTSWVNAYTELFKTTRELVGEDKIIISNGSSHLQHAPHVNGRMYESYPTPWEGNWHTVTSNAITLEGNITRDPIIIFNSDTNNTGNNTDYSAMRFGLTSALMTGSFFGFDYGTQSHQQIWTYDEYEAFIGEAKEGAVESNGVWTREFTHGKIVVNPQQERKLVNLGGEFEKINGTQDPVTNDGSILSRVFVDAMDGLILLRPLEEIVGGVFTNGAFARVFDHTGSTYRTGFFAYDQDSYGGMEVVYKDLHGDSGLEKVTADGNQVFIYNSDGSLHASFYPYTAAYQGGVNLAVGDLEADGTVEIVTGSSGKSGGGHVRVFNSDGVLINPGFFPYDEVYRGGIKLAIADLNADGHFEIVTGAGANGGPHVRMFNKHGKLINPGFFAFDPMYRGGVNIAAGDINGDGIDEIITVPGGKNGLTEIRVYDKDGNYVIEPFDAFPDARYSEINVTTADVDDDGIDDIIALTRDVFTLSSY